MIGLFSLLRRDTIELACSLGLSFFVHVWSCEHSEMVVSSKPREEVSQKNQLEILAVLVGRGTASH